MKGLKFSVVENLQLTSNVCSEIEFINGLKGKLMEKRIQPIRELIRHGEREKANELKKQLPAIMFSGIFEGGRTSDKLAVYSKIVCLDLDKIENDEIDILLEKINNCDFTFASFVSPSGCGIKVLVKVDSGLNYHKDAFKQVLTHYSTLIGKIFDEKTSDINRLTFMSYDPAPYHYPDSAIFPIKTPLSAIKSMLQPNIISNDGNKGVYEISRKYAEKKSTYGEGNRNNFMFLLASNCNRYGLPKDEFIRFSDWCDLEKSELLTVADSAYKRSVEFNTWKLQSTMKEDVGTTELTKPTYEEIINETPFLPACKKRLPRFFEEIVSDQECERQEDMAITAVFSILSGIMTTVKGVYNHSIISPAFNTFITAPSGSGKSITGVIQKPFLPLNAYLKESGIELFLSDNTTSTALLHQLSKNNGSGVLYSTDIGFLGHALKRDVSGIQAIFRASHSGEILNSARGIKHQPITVTEPKLAACMCATPPEFQFMFSSTEDGLISRFAHYCFVPDKRWMNVKINNVCEFEKRQKYLSQRILKLYSYLKNKQLEFRLGEEQLLALNEWLSEESEKASKKQNWNVITPIIRRTGHTVFKLSMIVAVLRAWERNLMTDILYIDNDDFDTVLQISKVYFEHAALIVNYISNGNVTRVDAQVHKFYSLLPSHSFKRKEAIQLAQQSGMQVSERTIDNWLKRLVQMGMLINDYNSYSKVMSQAA